MRSLNICVTNVVLNVAAILALAHGFDVHAADPSGDSYCTEESSSVSLQEMFYPTQPSFDINSISIFELLTTSDHYEALEGKLKQGSDPNICGPLGMSALQWASVRGQLDDVKLLLQYGASLEYPRGTSSGTALTYAIEYGQYDVAMYLLSVGASATVVYGQNMTALMALSIQIDTTESGSALKDTADIKQLAARLIRMGVPLNAVTSEQQKGTTALMYAISFGQSELANLLLDAGADPCIRRTDGRDALFYAKRIGDIALQNLLSKRCTVADDGYAGEPGY